VPGRIDLRALTLDVLGEVNADPQFDLAEYDANADGYVDYVFVVMREVERSTFFGGAAGFSSLSYTSVKPEFGNDESDLKSVRGVLGSYVRYNSRGVVIPELDLVRIMAHEFGHSLFAHFPRGHLWPMTSPSGVPAMESHKIGYALQVGRLDSAHPSADVRGDYTISAYERESLGDGWINCVMLAGDEEDVRIADLYAGGSESCFKLTVPDGPDRRRTVYLSNRQRVGFFDRQHSDSGQPGYTAGLQTTGLLVTASQSGPSIHDGYFGVVPADNTLALNDSAYSYEGDMYGPDTKVQLTPWTRPNVAAYATFPQALAISEEHFQAVDNIRYSGGWHNEMAFDYVRDFRQRPVIREDSWMGRETSGFEFTADVVVTHGATLTIETDVRISSSLLIEEGSTVVVTGQLILTDSSLLKMARGSCITGSGQVIVSGRLNAEDGARLDFSVGFGDETVAYTPVQFALDAAYPNPFNSVTTIPFRLPWSSDVALTVFDLTGRQIRLLASGVRSDGYQEIPFDATGLPTGIYFYRLEAGDFVETKSLVLLR
jgi:hypothetical protein